jgi:site-specific DNA recombinase
MQKTILGPVASSTLPNSAMAGKEHPPRNRTINGVIYCRVSSKEQIEGTSLESQEIACKEYAAAHNIRILKIFIERGESAKFADRTQLIELIDFCRTSKEKVQALLVWKLDRFARNVGDHFNIKATLLKYGVQVLSVTEPIDANPEGKLMETILAGFAQFDNDIRAARTVQGMRRKLQEGISPWRPPLGYLSPARESAQKTIPDEPDQPLFELLQKAWKAFATGAYRKADILRMMASWGIATKKGISMTAQSLDNFFGNPYYAGILIDPWSGERYQGKHVPMVTQEDFERVQGVVSRRSHSVGHERERAEFPLRGSARCSSCCHYLTGGFSRGRTKRYAYYNCFNRSCLSRRSYHASVVHEEFASHLARIAPKPEVVTILGERVLAAAARRHDEWKLRNGRKKTELERLEKQVQELIRMRAQGVITDHEFMTVKAKLSQRKMAVANAAAPEQCDADRAQAALLEIARPLSDLKSTWDSIPVGSQKRFKQLVLPAGFVVGGIRTAELGLLFRVCETFQGANSHLVPLTGESLNRLYQAIQAFAEVFRSVEEEKKAA